MAGGMLTGMCVGTEDAGGCITSTGKQVIISS